MTTPGRIPTVVLALAIAACTRSDAAEKKVAKAQPAVGTKVGETIPQFTADALDVTGDTEVTKAFDSHKTQAVTVYAFLGTHCPTTQMYLDRLRDLETAYRKKGVDFVFVYPNRTDPSDAKRAYHKSQRFGGPMIDDQGAKIAVATLAAHKTSEMLVVDRDRVIRYRGAIDDNKDASRVTRTHLGLALEEILAGKTVTTPTTDVFA